jgi:Lon protease-like protein
VKLYRQAKVEILEDAANPALRALRELQRTEILRHLLAIVSEENEEVTRFVDYLSQRCGPTTFSNVVAYSSPISTELKQELLEEVDVDKRLARMVEIAQTALSGMVSDERRDFPPHFSRA